MNFGRTALKFLTEWRLKSDRKPLVIRGARQVGKTTLVEMFAKNFKQFISLNLELAEDRSIFENKKNFEEVIDALYFLKSSNKSEKDTLLFIDEIQYSSEAIKYLRYFYENKKDIAVITAGSLLETLIDKEISYPVGRVEFFALRPFSFREYLAAMGEEQTIEAIDTIPFPAYAADKLMTLFKKYALIGGMPEVIKNFAEDGDLVRVKDIIKNLVLSYKTDVEKYARNDTVNKIIRHIIDKAFYFAGERIIFNRFGNSDYRSREVGECFRILEKTMLLKMVYPSTSTILPIIPCINRSPKLLLLDTGLVNFTSGIEKEIFQARELSDLYKGRIAEHIVGQELMTKEIYPDSNLGFWIRDKKQADAELDYLIKHKGNIVPIEVKSGTAGKLKSLQQFINLDASGESKKIGVRIYSGNLSVQKERTAEGKEYYLLNLPFYLLDKLSAYIDHVKSAENKII